MNRKRAWLYCRTAHPDATALEVQKSCLMDCAGKLGLSIIGVSAEYGSGEDFSRPRLCRALEATAGGEIDVVLVMKPSRLGRDPMRTDMCIHWLKEHGVNVVCADGTVLQPHSEILAWTDKRG